MSMSSSIFILIFILYSVESFTPSYRLQPPFTTRYQTVRRSISTAIGISDNENESFISYKEDNDGPKISIRDFDKEKRDLEEANRRLAPLKPSPIKQTSVFGSLDITKKLQQSAKTPSASSNRLNKIEDLNGIDPITSFFFAFFPLGMSYFGWQLSVYLAEHFAIQFVDSEIYPVQRFTIVARNLVVGMSSLATGFCGVVSLGLFLLSIRVGYGVLRGELDPKKTNA